MMQRKRRKNQRSSLFVPKTEQCNKCRGRGWVYMNAMQVECRICNGKGYLVPDKTSEHKIK